MATLAWILSLGIIGFLIARSMRHLPDASRGVVWPPATLEAPQAPPAAPQAPPQAPLQAARRPITRKPCHPVDPIVSEALAALHQLGHTKREAQSLIDNALTRGTYASAQALIAAVYQKAPDSP